MQPGRFIILILATLVVGQTVVLQGRYHETVELQEVVAEMVKDAEEFKDILERERAQKRYLETEVERLRKELDERVGGCRNSGFYRCE